MQPKRNIKGFTILELLVVITIVAIVSAVGYPNFMKWREDREIRAAMESAATMLSSINNLSQRGNFPFVQLKITPNGTTNTTITSKGMNVKTLSTRLNSGSVIDCSLTNSGYWDNHLVDKTTKNVSTHINAEGSVCFSQDGTHYKTLGKLNSNVNVTVEGRITNQYLIICSTSNASGSGKCPTNQADGLKQPAYLVEWTRFGNISKFKWSGSGWNRQ